MYDHTEYMYVEYMYVVQKDPPPSLPFNTRKTHEAQMSIVLKEPYLSSLGTHVNESWQARS